MPFDRSVLGIATSLLVLGLAASARSDARMYTGSLVIHAFGNDTSTVNSFPFFSRLGIPLTGKCHTVPYHRKETLTFPTTPTGTQVFTFTIPAYGGAMITVDTNGDSVPDIAPGCGASTVEAGDPLTGSGAIETTGAISTSHTPMDPRGFTLPRSALNKVKSGASLWHYTGILWEVHFADLHNDAGLFARNGGDGSFAVTHPGPKAKRKAVQTAGKNRFGGVMQLLGSYGDNEGYFYNPANVTTVFYYDWLFDYLGHGGQATADGVVTAGYLKSRKNYRYTRASGARGTSTVYAEVFEWTTGSVTVTAGGTFPTILRRKGYDHRTVMGSGAVQLVSPMLTRWVGAGEVSTASIGILKLTFAPEPGSLTMLSAGAAMLGLLFYAQRRAGRVE